MADIRDDLLRQMRALRRRLDPKLLERAKLAVFGKVPYDRDNARAAVSDFLDRRDDGGAFRRRLESELRRQGGALDLDAAGRPAPPSSAASAKAELPPGGGAPGPKPRRPGGRVV